MPASNLNAPFQFSRQFGVPLDKDFVFQTSSARADYLTNPLTSGLAYIGMIVADVETNEVYVLDSSRQWKEVGVTVNETFGASSSGLLVKTGNNSFRVGGLDAGTNIGITNPSGLSSNPSINLSASLTGLNSIDVIGLNGISSSGGLVVRNDATFYNNVNISGNLNLKGSQITFDQSTINSLFITANSGNFQTLTVNDTPVSLVGHSHSIEDILDFVENVQDIVGSGNGSTGFLRNGSGLAWTYDDNNHTLSARVTGIDTSLINNFASTVSGLFNDQFNNDLNAALIQGTGIGLSYNSDTEELTISVTGIPSSLITDFGQKIVSTTGNQTVSGIKTFTDIPVFSGSYSNGQIFIGSGTALVLNTLTQGDGVSISNAAGAITIGLDNTSVRTTGTQSIGGSKTFDNSVTFGAGLVSSGVLRVQASGAASSPTDLAVFSSSPTGTSQQVLSRSLSNIKSDLGLNNLTNHTQVRQTTDTTTVVGNIPVWNSTSGTLLGAGYSVETTLTGGTTAIPRADAVKSYVDASFNANDAMQFKGIVNQSNGLPTTTVSAGWTYRVTQTGTYAGVVCEVGDLIIATGDASGSINGTWTVVQTNIDGAVVGPASSTTDNFALFSGIGGKVIKDAGFGSGVFARSNLAIEISGTTNQINIDGGASASKDLSSNRTWTLSLPQNIHTGASPTFAGLTINGLVSAHGFSGSGNLLTNINADNITGVLDSGRLPVVHASTLTPTTTGPSGTFVSSINIDSYGRVTSLNRTTHTLATTGIAGIASFNSGDFDVSSGAVSIKAGGIANSQLEYNSITLGSTTISLGATTGILAGLSSISGTSVSSPTTLTFCVIDGGTP